MPAYLIARVVVDNTEIYNKYTEKSPGIVEKYGGKFLSRGSDVDVLEGSESNDRIVIIEFPNKESAHRFYQSKEYQTARLIRAPVSNAEFIVVDSFN